MSVPTEHIHPSVEGAAPIAPGKCPYTATKNAVAKFFGFAPKAGALGGQHEVHHAAGEHGSAARGHTPTTPAGASLHEALKAQTWPLHVRAEQHPFQAGIMRGGVGREGYIAQLEQTLLVHEALESHVARLRRSVPALAAMVRDYHARAPHARADLAALGGSTSPSALAPTRALIAEIEAAAATKPHALVGYLYVLEGSTNGAKFIAKALAKGLGINDGRGLSYQDPHGEKQRERWAEFKAGLNTLALSGQREGELIGAAESLFAWTIALFDVLAERHLPVATGDRAAVAVAHVHGAPAAGAA